MSRILFVLVCSLLSLVCIAQTQRVGIGVTAPVAKLDIRGLASSPAIPGATSTGVLRIGVTDVEGVDIGKMATTPYSGWIQSGFNGSTPDPLTLQPLGGAVGIGTTTPASSAALDVTSVNKGFLPPRMTLAQRNAISGAVAGLVVFCTNCGPVGELQVYSGAAWKNVLGGPTAPVLALNMYYKGGYIGYIYHPGDPGYVAGEVHGLIVWPNEFPEVVWPCDGYITGEPATALGTGYNNTRSVIYSCGGGSGDAIHLCWDVFSEDGYFDWFLPSKDELNKLYNNASTLFDYEYYWTSSEVNETTVWIQNFNTGIATYGAKEAMLAARPVRYF